MGGSTSTPAVAQLKGRQEDVVRHMMPLYYTTEQLTEKEFGKAKACWESIVNDTAAAFVELRQEGRTSQITCISFFYHQFYNRLFDVHPAARGMFKDVQSQGKFLVKMISLSLTERDDPVLYENTLVHLALIHNQLGVKAVEYGLVGDVLFWAVSRCVGPQVYNEEIHLAWTKIYSRMLRTIVPLAVAHEMKDSSAQDRRFNTKPIWRLSDEEKVSKPPADEEMVIP